jgi:hypothetical protein
MTFVFPLICFALKTMLYVKAAITKRRTKRIKTLSLHVCLISAWKIFIETFNGKSVFLKDHWQNSESLNLYTDASGNVGFAAVFGSWANQAH